MLQADLDLSGCKLDWLVSKLQQAATTEASAEASRQLLQQEDMDVPSAKLLARQAGMQLCRRRLQLYSRLCEGAAQYLD